MNPWLSAGLVFLVLAMAMATMTWLQRKRALHPEICRKTVHFVMGLVALAFPWLFASDGPRITLALSAIFLLALASSIRMLRVRMGNAILDIERRTYGHYCFVVSVLLLAMFHSGSAACYLIPALLLGAADTSAAIVGTFRGRTFCWGNHKTLEGSAAFFATAFLCAATVLCWTVGPRWNEILLMSLVVSLCCTVLEALLTRGWDNLGVPFASFCLMREYQDFNSLSLVMATATPLTLAALSWMWIEGYLAAEKSGRLSPVAVPVRVT